MAKLNKDTVNAIETEFNTLLTDNKTTMVDFVAWYAQNHKVVKSAVTGAMFKLWYCLSAKDRKQIIELSIDYDDMLDDHLHTALNTVYKNLSKA